jgi:hypothetical protein
MTQKTLDTISTTFAAIPYASIPSNEPYGVGDTLEASQVRNSLKEEWINNPESDYPETNYPLLNRNELIESERSLQKVLSELDNVVGSPEEIDLVYEQIARKLAEVYRHLEVVRGLGSVGLRQDLSRERAGDMTIDLFGRPDKDAVNSLVGIDIIAAQSNPSTNELSAAIKRDYLQLVGDDAKEYAQSDEAVSYEMLDETIEIIHGDLNTLFPGLEEALTVEGDKISHATAIDAFNAGLRAIGLADKGWLAEEGGGKAAKTSGADKKRITIGRDRAAFTPRTLKGVGFHELIAHALTAQNASEQENPALRRALPGSLAFAEGNGVALEQIVTGEKRLGGVPYYISLGLQLGLDRSDSHKRNFKEDYEVLWRRQLLSKSEVTVEDTLAAKRTAFQQAMRTIRGNSLDARDISYADGSLKANRWYNELAQLDETERLSKLKWVLSANFDPTNPEHTAFFDADTINR